MTETAPAPWGAAWRHRAYALVAFVLKVAILICLSSVVVTIGLYFQQSTMIAAYRSASSCAAPADALSGEACRYRGQARLLSMTSHEPFTASVVFDSLPTRTFRASWPIGGAPAMTAVTVGRTVDVELWNGMVTSIAGKPTIGDPELLPTFYLQAAAISVGGALLILLMWGLAIYAWEQRLGARPGGATAAPVRVPIRPAKLEHQIIIAVGLAATAIGVVTNTPYAVIAGLVGVVVGALVAWRTWPK